MQYIYSTNTEYSRGPLGLRIAEYTDAYTIIMYTHSIPSICLAQTNWIQCLRLGVCRLI